ncbi:MAG TPA: hypothetical protein VFV89_12795 [Nocardioides sp.]|uniref:hypothetical protein n=1 Tax=Nocardioides sp. TaxID=35761 RepID=UPI002E333460|nr:hypothetical protein [Nocardioides sp.]HEX5088681.1 hypothetical protein [Nocardioides sp.]
MRAVSDGQVRTVTGISSAIGGVAWVVACFVHNSLPQGCIDEQCADRTMRGSSPVATTLFVMAGLMLAISGIGLLLLTHQRRPVGRLGALAATTAALGLLLLGAAAVMSAVDNDWNGMPGLVIPGIFLLAVGLVLVAWVVLRARVVPTSLAALLVVTALLLPFANEQTSRILLAVPFGITWLVLGLVLLRDPGRRRSRPPSLAIGE